MDKCLVTKLQSSVNDESFPILGGFKVKVISNSSNGYVSVTGTKENPVEVYSPNEEITPNTADDIAVDSHTVKCVNGFFVPSKKGEIIDIIVKNKYGLRSILIGSGGYVNIDSSELKYSKGIKALIIQAQEVNKDYPLIFNINDCPSESITKVEILAYAGTIGLDIRGNFVEFLSKANPNIVTSVIVRNNDLFKESVAIENLVGRFTSITSMSFENSSKVVGSVENFVKAQRTNGRRTCDGITIPTMANLGNATFNGEVIQKTPGKKVLSWTETSITFNGVTVSV